MAFAISMRLLAIGALLAFILFGLITFNALDSGSSVNRAFGISRPSTPKPPPPDIVSLSTSVLAPAVTSPSSLPSATSHVTTASAVEPAPSGKWEFDVEGDANNYGLTDEQCGLAFPKLFLELESSQAKRKGSPITLKEFDSREVTDGMVRGFVHNGEVG